MRFRFKRSRPIPKSDLLGFKGETTGNTLYAVCFETMTFADVFYLHARDQADATYKVMVSRNALPRGARIVAIAPVIGYYENGGERKTLYSFGASGSEAA